MASGSLNRSCEACRAAKVRCQIEEDAEDSKCQRCHFTSRSCVFVARLPRKPRKRTDTRIKELEQKLQAMESTLLQPPIRAASHGWKAPDGSSPASNASRTFRDSHTRDRLSEGSITRQGGRQLLAARSSGTESSSEDATSRVIPNWEEDGLFQCFMDHYMSEYPLVVFPAGTDPAEVRSTMPTLFLATIAAASGSSDPIIFRALNVELLKEFAHKIMVSSMKGLELVQAMLVMAAWYFPPDRFEDLKHYQYIHMAATMAMDIGLGETAAASSSPGQSLSHGSPASIEEADSLEIEKYRTILACYLLCAG
jgi:hypothetical protein